MASMESSWSSPAHHSHPSKYTFGESIPTSLREAAAVHRVENSTAGTPTTANRGSLGKLIERSTSAPPTSTESYLKYNRDYRYEDSSSSLVGSDLLDHMSRNHTTAELDFSDVYKRGGTGLYKSAVEPLDHADLGSFLATGSNSGRSTAPSSDASSTTYLQSGFMSPSSISVSRPLSASGGAFGDHGSHGHSQIDHLHDGFQSGNNHTNILAAPLGPLLRSQSAAPYAYASEGGLVRSKSAAPSFEGRNILAPPPGLGLNSSGISDVYNSSAMRSSSSSPSPVPPSQLHQPLRLSSVGSLLGTSGSNHGALRPAAKTPMDLIQEDFPNESQSDGYLQSSATDQGNQHSRNVASMSSPLGSNRNHATRNDYPFTPQSSLRDSQDTTERSDPSRMGHQPSVHFQESSPSYTIVQHSVPPHHPSDEYAQQHQLRHEAMPAYTSRPMSAPVTSASSLEYHRRNDSPPELRYDSAGSMYTPVPASQPSILRQQVHLHHPLQSNQTSILESQHASQLYYNGSATDRLVHPHSLQSTQVIHAPNGQTLYVNSTPGHTPPTASPYGYATIQYHHPSEVAVPSRSGSQHHPIPQHRQVLHTNGAESFLSIVPMPSTGGSSGSNGSGSPPLATTPYWGSDPTASAPSTTSHSQQYQHHQLIANGVSGGASLINPISTTATANGRFVSSHHSSLLSTQSIVDGRSIHQPSHGNGSYVHGSGNTGVGSGGGGGSSRGRDKAGNGGGGRGRRGGGGGGGGGGNGSGRRGADSKHHGGPLCSTRLEEFRAMKNRDWTMHQIAGYVVEFCQDQNGSRFIQQRLEMGDPSEQQVVAREVLPAIRRLRNDVFGNYVVQKLLDFGSPQVKADIRDTLEGEMLQLSLQMYGCRVVQKALEALDEDDVCRLLVEFHYNVLSCIHDQNGNHVIQKCIEVMSKRSKKERSNGDTAKAALVNQQISFIIDDILVNSVTLSCHPYGCRVLQRILEHCDQARKEEVLNEIQKWHKKLLDDQYGNYVIQHVLQFGREQDRDGILKIVVENGLLGLSRQKFASNVVEKLLKYGNERHRRAIVREMLKNGDDPALSMVHAISSSSSPGSNNIGCSVVLLMVRDAYANYVVQTTLDVVPESQEKVLLLQELNAHSEELRQYTFAKHIVAKLSTMTATL